MRVESTRARPCSRGGACRPRCPPRRSHRRRGARRPGARLGGDGRLSRARAPTREHIGSRPRCCRARLPTRQRRGPALKSLYRTNSVPATTFVGRGHELDELGALLDRGVRLLTLTGPGGVGGDAARAAGGRRRRGSLPRRCGGYRSRRCVIRPRAVLGRARARVPGASAARVRGEPDRRALSREINPAARTTSSISSPSAAGRRAATLRDASLPSSRVESGSSSRASTYPVAPLVATEATELFSARLRLGTTPVTLAGHGALRPTRQPPARSRARGGWTGLAPAEILSRLGGRLDKLTGGRDADPRQQTLRATIAWSHDLLDRPERDVRTAGRLHGRCDDRGGRGGVRGRP